MICIGSLVLEIVLVLFSGSFWCSTRPVSIKHSQSANYITITQHLYLCLPSVNAICRAPPPPPPPPLLPLNLKKKNIFEFSIVYQHRNGERRTDYSSWTMRTHLIYSPTIALLMSSGLQRKEPPWYWPCPVATFRFHDNNGAVTKIVFIDTTYGAGYVVSFMLWGQNFMQYRVIMMTSSNGNIFRVTDPLCEEFTGHRWIPLTKASDAELWCFLWSVPEQTVEQTIETVVIWDTIAPIMTSL